MPGLTRAARQALRLLTRSLRFIVGGALITLGILGVILPILPGMPFLILGTLVIGRHSRLLRQMSVGGKRLLRSWAHHPRPHIAKLGRWSRVTQRDSSRRVRHIVWWLRARRSRPGVPSRGKQPNR